jgi:mannose-6-phosphate isomerase-like protein (cupin superfamily)
MQIITRDDGSVVKNDGSISAQKLLSKEEVEVVRIRLQADSSLPVHTTPVDVFFYIIEGSGEVEIGEEREKVEAGMIVESPKDIPHGLHNRSKAPFEVLVVKTPKP